MALDVGEVGDSVSINKRERWWLCLCLCYQLFLEEFSQLTLESLEIFLEDTVERER